MKVYFRDSHGKKRLLKEVETKEDAWKVMQNFMDDHNFKCYYARLWFEDGYTWFDVGSHTEYFLVDENLMGQYENDFMGRYENEQEEEKEIARGHTTNSNKYIGYRPE